MLEQGAKSVDFSRLNDAERRVLHLLAEGHTAKSVANELGSTPAAVNERLREARRKTGVGSSRELARLLKSQEIRHDQLGMADPLKSGAFLWPAVAEPWRPQPGVWVMIALLMGALAAAALIAGQTPGAGNQAGPVVDPLIGAIPNSEVAPDRLYQKLRSEPRDAAWAVDAEKNLRDRYAKIPHIGSGKAFLRVLCASTLCEVAGTIDAPEPSASEIDDPKQAMNKAVRDLQDKPLIDDLRKAGFEVRSGTFGQSAAKQPSFVFYFARAKG